MNIKLSEFQTQIFDQHKDQLGLKVYSEFFNFLCNFTLDPNDPNYKAYAEGAEDQNAPIKYYVLQAEKLKADEKINLFIDYSHVSSFQFKDANFQEILVSEYNRYEPYMRRAVTQFMNLNHPQYAKEKFFQIGFYNLPRVNKLREMKSNVMGRLVSIHGTVTRTTEVKPELLLGSFKCQECNTINGGVEQQYKFTQPVRCRNENCGNKIRWELLNNDSVFIDWQKLRVQEHSGDIPAGSMPRSIDVILRGEIVDMAKPGDRSIFTGNLVVVPDIVQLLKPGEKAQSSAMNTAKMRRNEARVMDGVTGLKRLGVKDLSYKLVFIANSVHSADSRFGYQYVGSIEEEEREDALKQFSYQERETILRMKDQDDLYTKLSKSIAPSVYSHQDVKKGVLLQLFGGIHKKTQEGIKLRGDINICIVGDPSTAKSQFLKYICSFLPRAIYTSGKASSAAGLTASVMKDPETGEFCIEAGALMLADHGICCIDEFDKMDVKDQVAIHEAMEQQTISLAKSGIHATLNARSSILAAANPLFGRYDRSKSLRYNVDISAPIMSRFDLFFVIFDEKKDEEDFLIATHIVNMHRLKEGSLSPDFTMEELQNYIKFCRALKPQFTKESAQILKEEYKRSRQTEKNSNKSAYKVTVRQLESLVRLSEAMARAHCDTVIRPQYVREVCRLMRSSNINIVKGDIEIDDFQEELNRAVRDQQINKLLAGKPGQDEIQAVDKQEEGQRKVKITFEEYQKVALMIIAKMKDCESKGQDNVQQYEIVDQIVKDIEMADNRETSLQRSLETKKKIQQVIQYMITKENILMVAQDAKTKDERYLTLDINVNIENAGGALVGSGEAQLQIINNQMSKVPHANVRKSMDKSLVQEEEKPAEQPPLNEEEMQNQQDEDDADIRALKEKLKLLSEQKPPENKDDLIQHLMERLQHAETAIGACEEVISHERENRKVISKELKAKNQELRDIVNAEKQKLRDKVHEELEKTLNQALKEKMKAETKYQDAVKVMGERDCLVEELDDMFIKLREVHRTTERLNIDQQKIIEHLEEELQQTKDDRDRLQHLSDERQMTIQNLNNDLDEAYGVITRLEEARIVLNRLLGPGGVITERERQKFLKGVQESPIDNQRMGAQRRDSQGPKGIGQANNQMLNANNQYFYEGGKPGVGAGKKGSPNRNIVQNTSLLDDANEDDFWYQAPKMGAEAMGGALGGEYQGYVNNPTLSSGGGGIKGKY